jgi:hypothetical protein
VEGDELISRVHGHPNDILGEAGFRSGGGVNDVTWNRERLGNLLLFGQALQSSKASETANEVAMKPSVGSLMQRLSKLQVIMSKRWRNMAQVAGQPGQCRLGMLAGIVTSPQCRYGKAVT